MKIKNRERKEIQIILKEKKKESYNKKRKTNLMIWKKGKKERIRGKKKH